LGVLAVTFAAKGGPNGLAVVELSDAPVLRECFDDPESVPSVLIGELSNGGENRRSVAHLETKDVVFPGEVDAYRRMCVSNDVRDELGHENLAHEGQFGCVITREEVAYEHSALVWSVRRRRIGRGSCLHERVHIRSPRVPTKG
jgi:hypothetical protein